MNKIEKAGFNMEEVVGLVKNGMYLGKIQSDDLRISASFDYHSDFRQALIMPLSAYNEHDGKIREQVNEIAKFAEGEVAVMTVEENIKTFKWR